MEAITGIVAGSPAQSRLSAFISGRGELLVLPVVVLLLAIPQLAWPLQYNEAMFVVFGREILEGALPYRDVFDQKPPLIYYFYASIQAVSGDGFMVARVLIYASLGLTSVLVALIAREFYSRRLAFVAGAALALTTGLVAIADNAGLDQATLLPLTAAVYLVLRWCRTRSPRLLVLAGVAAALAVLLKPVALPTVAFLAGLVLLDARRLRPAFLFACSGLVVGLVALLGLVAAGILDHAYDAMVTFGREYAAFGRTNARPAERALFWAMALGPLVVPSVPSLVLLARQGGRRFWVLGGLAVAAAIGIALPGVLLPYYAWLACPPLALLSIPVFEWLPSQRRAVRLAVLLPGALVFTLTTYVAIQVPAELERDGAPAQQVGTSIRAVASEGDRLWVRANQPPVYYYANLRPAHRYFTPQALGIRPRAEEATVAELTASPPRFIVVAADEDFTPLLALLEDRFALLAKAGELLAYRRLD